jgi:ABC-type transporter Mla subunit MlaD
METTDGEIGDNATQEDAAHRIKTAAASVLEQTKQVASETAQRGKETVASSVQTAASSLRRAADQTQDENALIGKTLRSFADGLEKASHSIEGADLNRSLQDINAFARREPAIFLGASFALGFALARFGKATIERAAPSAGAAAPQNYDGFGG